MTISRRGVMAGLIAAAGLPYAARAGFRQGRDPVPFGTTACRTPAMTDYTRFDGGFLALYADNRARRLPNLITESFLVHAVALGEARARRAVEAETLVPLFKAWVAATATTLATATPPNLVATQLVSVLTALLGGAASTDRAVAAELKLVAAAGGIAPSPILGIAIDYSQLAPRGDYADDPGLAAYFRASRYASTTPLLLNPSPATGVDAARATRFAATARALSAAMTTGAAASLTTQLFTALTAAFGAAEDYGAPDLDLALAPEALRLRLVADAPARGRVPGVVDVPLDVARLGKLSSGEAAISFRLLPGRRLGDVAALQALTYPATGVVDGDGGSFAAGKIDGKIVKAYVGFDDLFAVYGADAGRWAVEGGFAGIDAAQGAARRALAVPSGPSDALGRFMRRALATPMAEPALTPRLLALGGHYVHYRHGLALYAKQSMTSSPKGLTLSAGRDPGVLETDLGFLAALRGLVADHARRLPSPAWAEWDRLLGDLEAVAWRSSFACPAGADGELLNGLDLAIAALVDRADDAPIVTDIHTVPTENAVVELGIGTAMAITAGGRRGADFSLYQFKQPIAARLTDAAFVARLAADPATGNWRPAIAAAR